jgi:hypothetical protein
VEVSAQGEGLISVVGLGYDPQAVFAGEHGP